MPDRDGVYRRVMDNVRARGNMPRPAENANERDLIDAIRARGDMLPALGDVVVDPGFARLMHPDGQIEPLAFSPDEIAMRAIEPRSVEAAMRAAEELQWELARNIMATAPLAERIFARPRSQAGVDAAKLRAEELLRDTIPAASYLELCALGRFDAVGRDTKNVYRLRRDRKTEVGDQVACIQLPDGCPVADRLVAEYLLIRGDEAEYRRTANFSPLSPYAYDAYGNARARQWTEYPVAQPYLPMLQNVAMLTLMALIRALPAGWALDRRGWANRGDGATAITRVIGMTLDPARCEQFEGSGYHLDIAHELSRVLLGLDVVGFAEPPIGPEAHRRTDPATGISVVAHRTFNVVQYRWDPIRVDVGVLLRP